MKACGAVAAPKNKMICTSIYDLTYLDLRISDYKVRRTKIRVYIGIVVEFSINAIVPRIKDLNIYDN